MVAWIYVWEIFACGVRSKYVMPVWSKKLIKDQTGTNATQLTTLHEPPRNILWHNTSIRFLTFRSDTETILVTKFQVTRTLPNQCQRLILNLKCAQTLSHHCLHILIGVVWCYSKRVSLSSDASIWQSVQHKITVMCFVVSFLVSHINHYIHPKFGFAWRN